jgi:diaminopropionate ammonia-lyase
VVSLRSAAAARSVISQWPGYSPTPLRTLTPLARQLGLAEILYKDESNRFSLGSFKALGGAYAATLEVQRLLRKRGIEATPQELIDGVWMRDAAGITVGCATDGNHGVSVAYAAGRMGCPCIIYMHEHASSYREQHMRRLGATVRRTPGTYDDSVRTARDAIGDLGGALIADTSVKPFEQVPAEVIQGYTVMLLEILDQHPDAPPTHVFVQGGVGGLAAACAGMLAERFGEQRPTVIVVEPHAAACLLASARLGRATKVDGDLATVMGMLSCGEASPIAWTILQGRADAFMSINDAAAVRARDFLSAEGFAFSVGLSGAAGVAGLMALMDSKTEAASLNLNGNSRVWVFGTEAA